MEVQTVDNRRESLNSKKMRMVTILFHEISDGVFITNKQGNIIDLNPAFTQKTGYSREEVLGKPLNFIQPKSRDFSGYESFWKAVHQTGAWSGKAWVSKKSGESCLVQLKIKQDKEKSDRDNRYIGFIQPLS
jgi:MFS transporter, NNP family, nitrate/nitrite transporter